LLSKEAEVLKTARYKFFKPDVVAKGASKSDVIPLLQKVQVAHGYVPEEAIHEISKLTGSAKSDIFSVVTFYKQFRLRPPGKYLIKICDGTACHVNDSTMLINVLRDELKLDDDADTSKDGLFTVETVACLGCCSIGPVVFVNEDVHGKLTPQKVRRLLKEYQRKAQN
jgi:NADH-quinone oxidoreductase subunit E